MADLVLPLTIQPNSCEWTLNDFTGVQESVLSGAISTVNRGQRWAAKMSYHDLIEPARTTVAAFVASMCGRANRAWLWDPSYVQAGSFPGQELFANSNFANGTTGWGAQNCTIRVTGNGRLRLTNNKSTGTNNFAAFQTPTLALGVPYVLRSLLWAQKAQSMGVYGAAFSPSASYTAGVTNVMATNWGIAWSNGSFTNYGGVFDTTGILTQAWDIGDILYASLQQCGLLDNAPNLFLQSNAFGTSPWALSNTTIGLTNILDPQGATTGVQLLENTTNASHATNQPVTVTGGAAIFCINVWVKAGTRSLCYLELNEATGGTNAAGWFNTATGLFGTVTTGANWSNTQTWAVNYGNGWWRISLASKKTNAATTVTGWIGAAATDGVISYAGVASAIALNLWHGSFAQSGAPMDDALTTTSAIASGTTQLGNVINVRGLPVSTNGLLLAGDRFEVNGEMKVALSDLNSDASGLGAISFEPALRQIHNDGEPIIIGRPMGRFVLAGSPAHVNRPGIFSDYDLDFSEA